MKKPKEKSIGRRLRKNASHAYEVVFSIVVLALISAPLLLMISGIDINDENIDNRELAKRPSFSFNRITSFPERYENYFNDNFPLRAYLVQLNSFINIRIFRQSPVDTVLIGREPWFFFTGDNLVKDFTGDLRFSDDELASIRNNLERRRDWVESRGKKFIIFVAPNKQSIYPEYMPENLLKSDTGTRFDQLLEYLSLSSDLEIMDMRQDLLNKKEEKRLYHHTDTHWNEHGAFIAYQKVMNKLATEFPELSPREISDFEIITDSRKIGDLSEMMAMERFIKEDWIKYIPLEEPSYTEISSDNDRIMITQNSNSELPSAVIFRDSFTEPMEHFFSEHFSRTVYVWDHSFNKNILATEDPDIVIHQIVERYLFLLAG